MAQIPSIENYLREHRVRRGWSQEELARRAGLSRAGISAIETDRLVPSAAAVLALAEALECRVEDLFQLRRQAPNDPVWAWPSGRESCRYWAAEVEGVERLYPAEPTALGMIPHDGVIHPGAPWDQAASNSRRTLVMACCDPAVGLLAAALAGTAGVRLLALQRPSRAALELLEQGLVHAAGVHLSRADEPGGMAESSATNSERVTACSASPGGRKVSPWPPSVDSARSGPLCIQTCAGSAAKTGPEHVNALTSCWAAGEQPPGAWPPTTAASPRPFAAAGPMPASASAWSARRPGWTFLAFVKRPTISASPPALPATTESRRSRKSPARPSIAKRSANYRAMTAPRPANCSR